jgi:hypothetical protein
MEQENKTAEGAPVKIKAMRRQPCPCGSGKVFKNCHEGDPGYEVATDPATAAHAPLVAPKNAPKGPVFGKAQGSAKQFDSHGHKSGGNTHRRKV